MQNENLLLPLKQSKAQFHIFLTVLKQILSISWKRKLNLSPRFNNVEKLEPNYVYKLYCASGVYDAMDR